MDTAIPVGALIGVIASLVGTWAAYRLLVAKEVRQRHAELKDALRLVKIELTSQSAVLTSSGADTRVDCTAYEALKARALLASLPTDLATQIVRAYLLLARMNEARQDRDNTWYGMVAAGRTQDDLSKFNDAIRSARSDAEAEVAKCVIAVSEYLK